MTTVNYNRDIECFPIVKSILTKITGEEGIYNSPTDMGVNMAGYGIVDDEVWPRRGAAGDRPPLLQNSLRL